MGALGCEKRRGGKTFLYRFSGRVTSKKNVQLEALEVSCYSQGPVVRPKYKVTLSRSLLPVLWTKRICVWNVTGDSIYSVLRFSAGLIFHICDIFPSSL